MYESAQKTRSGRTSGGDEISEYKAKVSDLQYQVHVLEDELAEMKLRASKSNADAIALKSNYEIQVGVQGLFVELAISLMRIFTLIIVETRLVFVSTLWREFKWVKLWVLSLFVNLLFRFSALNCVLVIGLGHFVNYVKRVKGVLEHFVNLLFGQPTKKLLSLIGKKLSSWEGGC